MTATIIEFLPDKHNQPELRSAIERLGRTTDVVRIALMPDAHVAEDVCVGTVTATTQRILPAAVGGDIGCGMVAIRLQGQAALLADRDRAALVLAGFYERIPHALHQAKNARLEVLLEAGDDVAANRIVELSDDFVIQAIASVVLVLDHDALQSRMGEGGDDADAADKAIESCLSEEIDGYLLISRKHDGWDAMLASIVALDRDHRSFLVRVLDRCADMASGYLDDLDELAHLLTADESLAEDVEAEREDRRGKQGYVEAQAAKNFLALSKMPVDENAPRDPVTRAYFRDLEPVVLAKVQSKDEMAKASRLLEAVQGVLPEAPRLLTSGPEKDEKAPRIMTSIRLLAEEAPKAFQERMEEFAYLTNVIVAGAAKKEGRFELAEAAEAVLATVALGAEIVAMNRRGKKRKATERELLGILQETQADLLFRKAASTLAASGLKRGSRGFLKTFADFKVVRRILCGNEKKQPT